MGALVTASFGVTKNKIDFHLTPAAQTGRISGTVVDDETGEGVASAVVRASNATHNATATADANGGYRIESLPSGDYRVTAELAPYSESEYGNGALVRVTPPNPTTGIDLRLVRVQAASVSPATGPLAGGTWITIAGKNFIDGTKVRIGDAEAQVVSVTPSMIVAITPPGPAGPADVTVLASSTRTSTIADGFVYTPGTSKRRPSRH